MSWNLLNTEFHYFVCLWYGNSQRKSTMAKDNSVLKVGHECKSLLSVYPKTDHFSAKQTGICSPWGPSKSCTSLNHGSLVSPSNLIDLWCQHFHPWVHQLCSMPMTTNKNWNCTMFELKTLPCFNWKFYLVLPELQLIVDHPMPQSQEEGLKDQPHISGNKGFF